MPCWYWLFWKGNNRYHMVLTGWRNDKESLKDFQIWSFDELYMLSGWYLVLFSELPYFSVLDDIFTSIKEVVIVDFICQNLYIAKQV